MLLKILCLLRTISVAESFTLANRSEDTKTVPSIDRKSDLAVSGISYLYRTIGLI